ncbi:hypothetical protein K0504_10130 [Neiella marina]|uniref:Uncharacterized protein n=1 Tax=Neiella holothuriorum TaxID=2870530 RepID=A0ABS7EI16_9GAMM|nr:hypothetical protein [Neiella holothuriorum]MBW8191396.1 hypothetical protein [Neiella holothuriorum]
MYRALLTLTLTAVSVASLAQPATATTSDDTQTRLFIESVAHNCPSCADNLMFIANLRAQHCGEPITIGSLREVASNRSMYPFLLALETASPEAAASLKPLIAESVDCADEQKWLADARLLWDEYKEQELRQLSSVK